MPLQETAGQYFRDMHPSALLMLDAVMRSAIMCSRNRTPTSHQIRMTSLTNRVSTFVLLVWLYTATAICPLDCFCRLDERGRRKTSCLQGGLIGPVPVAAIDKNTQVLEISAPKSNPNWLLLGAVFQTLTSLEELHVMRSCIPEIGKHAFWGVKGLQVLNLAENNLSTVHDHNFRGLANLRELDLSDNKIEQLTTGGFKYLTDLRVLNLARNRLEELDARVFERLGNLQKLNLNGNHLKELYPEVFMDIQELRILECRQCALRSINTQIYHLLPHLTSLDLGDNDFFYLTNDEFYDLRKLKHLWLDGNHLPVVLEKTFVMQRELQQLSLAGNRLAKITNSAFLNVTTLTDLDISFNKLYRIEPAVFVPIAESLQRLDLSGNKILEVDLKYSLQGLGQLRYLGLAQLNLTEVPVSLLMTYDKLHTLNLSGNLLETFPSQLPMSHLSQIDLTRNQFFGLEERALIRLEQIGQVYLDLNPWSCDLCHILPMLNRVNKSGFSSQLTCASPKTLKQRTLASIVHSELNWCGEDLYESSDTNFFQDYSIAILIVSTSLLVIVILVGSIVMVRLLCFKRQVNNYYIEDDKRVRASSSGVPPETLTATAVFGQNGEISFKFPLDAKLSIATIGNDIKKVPNGTL